VLSHENRLKNALFTANNVILRKKICVRPNFFKNFKYTGKTKEKTLVRVSVKLSRFKNPAHHFCLIQQNR
jgi:hypothetical protein